VSAKKVAELEMLPVPATKGIAWMPLFPDNAMTTPPPPPL
jgi:hypothetical protein